MHIHLIDHYLPIKSPIHQLDARIKVLFTLAFICSCALLPPHAWLSYSFMAGLIFCLIPLSNLRMDYLLKRSLFVMPFILAAFPLIFRASEPLLTVFSIGQMKISISYTGLIVFISVGAKSWLSVLAATLLASTTSFPDLLSALRAVKIPRILVAVLGLMWRYLSLMVEEASRLSRARLSRSCNTGGDRKKAGGGILWRAKVTGGMAGSLFIRSLERSERVYHAMLSRGYDGDIRTVEIPKLSTLPRIILVLIALMFSLLILLSYLLWTV